MTLYPEAQRKAQEELDRVVGPDRLPTFADRELLPYVEALVTEVFRWNPVVPLGRWYRDAEGGVADERPTHRRSSSSSRG